MYLKNNNIINIIIISVAVDGELFLSTHTHTHKTNIFTLLVAEANFVDKNLITFDDTLDDDDDENDCNEVVGLEYRK